MAAPPVEDSGCSMPWSKLSARRRAASSRATWVWLGAEVRGLGGEAQRALIALFVPVVWLGVDEERRRDALLRGGKSDARPDAARSAGYCA